MLVNIVVSLKIFLDNIKEYLSNKKPSKLFLSVLALASTISSFVIILYTGTRGVVLAMILSSFVALLLVAYGTSSVLIKRLVLGILLLASVSVGILFAYKNSEFVKSNQILNRVTHISLKEGTGFARTVIWSIAAEGVKEKPILGWGPEGFIYVFDKYYDPRACKQEQWFDRAHNMPMEILIWSGFLGFVVYVLLALSVIYSLISLYKKEEIDIYEFTLWVFAFVSYSVYLLSAFDTLITYLFIFTLLAYLHFKYTHKKHVAETSSKITPFSFIVLFVGFVVYIASLYFFIVLPYNKNEEILNALKNKTGVILLLKSRQALLVNAQNKIDKSKQVKDLLSAFFEHYKNAKHIPLYLGNQELIRESANAISDIVTLISQSDLSQKEKMSLIAFVHNNIYPTIKKDYLKFTSKYKTSSRLDLTMAVLAEKMGDLEFAKSLYNLSIKKSPKKITSLAMAYSFFAKNDKALADKIKENLMLHISEAREGGVDCLGR